MTLEESAATNSFQDWTQSVRTFERSLRMPPKHPVVAMLEDTGELPSQVPVDPPGVTYVTDPDPILFTDDDVRQAIRIFTESPGARPARMLQVMLFALQVASINLGVK